MPTVWDILNERNTSVFRNFASIPFIVLEAIKWNAALWSFMGAKRLGGMIW
jgi:hypothetical protein